MKMFAYAKLVIGHGFRDVFNKTSIIYALASLALALWAGPNSTVASLTTYDVALYASYALGFFLAFRVLLTAPYHLWCEATGRAEIAEAELRKPAHLERQAMASLRAAKRMELIGEFRQMHMAAAQHDETAWNSHLRAMASLHPMVSTDASIERAISKFVHAGIKVTADKKADADELKDQMMRLIDMLEGF